MVRKIVQLTEAQAEGLKERAKKEGVSVAELVRRGVDDLLTRPFITDEMRERAKKCVGVFLDAPDLSVNHDKYYADAIESHIRGHVRVPRNSQRG